MKHKEIGWGELHKQVKVHHPILDTEIEVDEGLANLLPEIWKAGISTLTSCQENEPDWAYICFQTNQDACRFVNQFIAELITTWEYEAHMKFIDGIANIFSIIHFPIKQIAKMADVLKKHNEKVVDDKTKIIPESKVDFIEPEKGTISEIHIESLIDIPPEMEGKELQPVVGLMTDGINFKVRMERDGKVKIQLTKKELEYESKKWGRKIPQIQSTVKTWQSVSHFIRVLAIEADRARKKLDQLKAASKVAVGEFQEAEKKYNGILLQQEKLINDLRKQLAERRRIIVQDNSKRMFAAGAAFAQRQK